MLIEILEFIFYSSLIVIISKYFLVTLLRKLAENLNLKAHSIGKIAGIATSIPEFLTVGISSLKKLSGTSIYNIFSSNIINLLQYIFAIIINKNYKEIKNKGIKISLFLVLLTIIIPSIFILFNIEINICIIPIFLILYFIFTFFTHIINDKYFKNQDKMLLENEEITENKEKSKNKKTYIYIIYLIISGILIYLVSDKLGNNLENLAEIFKIPESILGILLGFITSIPELITFFESQKYYKNNEEEKMLGVVEATHNLLTSNMLNLFIIQSLGILLLFV